MQNTFEILSGFLSRINGEVEGRELSALTPEIAPKLRRFPRRQLTKAVQSD